MHESDSKGKCFDCREGWCAWKDVTICGVKLDQYGCLRKETTAISYIYHSYDMCKAGQWPYAGNAWHQPNETVEMVGIVSNAYAEIREKNG